MGISVKAAMAKRAASSPAFVEAQAKARERFDLVRELLAARARAGMTQADVAAKMGTSQSAVARMERAGATPTLASLQRYAEAVGCRARIQLVPVDSAERSTRLEVLKAALSFTPNPKQLYRWPSLGTASAKGAVGVQAAS